MSRRIQLTGQKHLKLKTLNVKAFKLLGLLFMMVCSLSCGKTKEITPGKEYEDKSLNIEELVGFIGKTYESIKPNLSKTSVVEKERLGDITARLFLKASGAPQTTFSCKLTEKNGAIAEILVSSEWAGHELNKNAFQYFFSQNDFSFFRVIRREIFSFYRC